MGYVEKYDRVLFHRLLIVNANINIYADAAMIYEPLSVHSQPRFKIYATIDQIISTMPTLIITHLAGFRTHPQASYFCRNIHISIAET